MTREGARTNLATPTHLVVLTAICPTVVLTALMGQTVQGMLLAARMTSLMRAEVSVVQYLIESAWAKDVPELSAATEETLMQIANGQPSTTSSPRTFRTSIPFLVPICVYALYLFYCFNDF